VSELFFFVEAFLAVDDVFMVVSLLVAVPVWVLEAVLIVLIVSLLLVHEATNPMAKRTVTEEISKRFIGFSQCAGDCSVLREIASIFRGDPTSSSTALSQGRVDRSHRVRATSEL
jgi:hypothetical protein